MTAREDHQHTPDEERKVREAALDRTIENSFPASDPPSTNPNPADHGELDPVRVGPGGGQDFAGSDGLTVRAVPVPSGGMPPLSNTSAT
jgi:hypothetical protein